MPVEQTPIIRESSAEKRAYRGFAMAQMRILKEYMRLARLNTYSRIVKLQNGVVITCKVCFNREDIYVSIPDTGITFTFPKIFLTDFADAWGYDWTSDLIEEALFTNAIGTVSQGYDGRCQVDDLVYSTWQGGWSTGLTGNDYDYLGGLNDYELAFFRNGNAIHGRIGEFITPMTTMDGTILDGMAGAYNNLFGIASYHAGTKWNLFNAPRVLTINPANKSPLEAWRWVPNVFYAQDGNGLMSEGWYYGQFPNSYYLQVNRFGDLDSAPIIAFECSFKGFLDTKQRGTSFDYGYCEVVKLYNEEELCDFNFYLSPDPLEQLCDNTMFTYEYTTTQYDGWATMGTASEGINRSFNLSLDHKFQDADVNFWTFFAYVSNESDPSAVGIVISKGASAVAYKYKGGLTPVYSTERFHSSSVSRDGKILAIFETDGSIIDRVAVIDLFGTTILGETGVGDYTGGGFTVLRNSQTIKELNARDGVIIPFRSGNEATLKIPLYDMETSSPYSFDVDNRSDYYPSMSTLKFPWQPCSPPIFEKFICENGVDVTYKKVVDQCFESTIILEDFGSPDAGKKRIGYADFLPAVSGTVRGEFTPGAVTPFVGEAVGEPITTITKQDTFNLVLYSYVGWVPQCMLGEIVLGDCLVEEDGHYYSDPLCCNIIDDHLVVEASSTCGQTAQSPYATVPEMVELTNQYGTNIVNIGYQFSPSGLAPVTMSMGCGDINPTTGYINSVSGCCGAGTITVTDRCGRSIDTVVRFVNGAWTAYVYVFHPEPRLASPYNWGSGTCYIGSTAHVWYVCGDGFYEYYSPLSTPCEVSTLSGNTFVYRTASRQWYCP